MYILIQILWSQRSLPKKQKTKPFPELTSKMNQFVIQTSLYLGWYTTHSHSPLNLSLATRIVIVLIRVSFVSCN